MDGPTYIKNCKRTESVKPAMNALGGVTPYMPSPALERSMLKANAMLHAAMGTVTEAGELMDALKKHYFYGAPLGEVNLVEELGDLTWYIAIMLHALDVSFEELFDRNIAKLRDRYPEKFTTDKALHRDLEVERDALEGRA